MFCDLLLNRRTATWNLFVLYNKEKKNAVSVNTGGHSIRVLNERTVGDGRNLCLLWLGILKSV